MARTPKDAARSAGAKVNDRAEEKRSEPPPVDPVQALRGELMRTQRDLEASRLELQEHKRKTAQSAMVHTAELKEARSERDALRMQVDALRAELASPKKRKREEPEEDDRAAKLEEELAEARADLPALRKKLQAEIAAVKADSETQQAGLRAALSQVQAAHAQAQAALAEARRELEQRASQPPPVQVQVQPPPPPPPPSAPPPVQELAPEPPPPHPQSAPPPPPESAPPPSQPPQPQRGGFLGKLFGRR